MLFLFATEAELGYDPKVALDENDLQYTYEIPNSDGEGSRFYRTIKPISEYHSNNITGRMTCVWLTREVASATHSTPIGPECILKDVWLDASVKTEQELQNTIFNDIQKAFEPDAIGSTVENKRLKDIKQKHAGIVASGVYRKYFLEPLADYRGETSKEVSPWDARKQGYLVPGNLNLIPHSIHAARPCQIFSSPQSCPVKELNNVVTFQGDSTAFFTKRCAQLWVK